MSSKYRGAFLCETESDLLAGEGIQEFRMHSKITSSIGWFIWISVIQMRPLFTIRNLETWYRLNGTSEQTYHRHR